MINFRYHLVSVAAILIALAAGVALGSGPFDDASDSIRGDDATGAQIADPAVRSFDAGFAAKTAAGLLKDKLNGQTVLIMTVPGTSASEVKGLTADLVLAGAQVVGQVGLTGKMLDPTGRQFAEGVAQQSASDVPGVTAAGDSYGRIGAALARAFVGDNASAPDQTATTIRSAFVEGDLVTVERSPSKLATLTVLVTSPQRSGGSDQSTVIAALASSLNGSGKGIVVAGPASSGTDGGAVKAVRDGAAASELTTVDVTDSPAGLIVTVLAAVQQVGGQPGSWGTSRSTSGAFPG